MRQNSNQGKRSDNSRKDYSKGRTQSKTPERPKSELFKNVEELRKEMKELKDLVKEKIVSGNFVEEEVVIDVNYMNDGAAKMMLVDCGAPKSVVSKKWIDSYLGEMKVDENEVERRSCCRRFRMGETTYVSEVEITFPIVLKTDDKEYMKNII